MRKRWRRVQYLANLFWTRWKREYLLTLQQRSKWNSPKRNVAVGDIVLVKDDSAPRNTWPLGRVIKTEPDKNGFVRSVQLKTQTSELRRPVDKVVLLLAKEEQSCPRDEGRDGKKRKVLVCPFSLLGFSSIYCYLLFVL